MKLFSFLFVCCLIPAIAQAADGADNAVNTASGSAQAQNAQNTQNAQNGANAFSALDWHPGPKTENVASKATLKTNADMAFLDEENSKKFLALTGNVPEPGNFIIVSKKDHWWGTFSFNPIGYVKDSEKIDADSLLQQLKDNDEKGNEERKRLNIAPLYTEGWYIPPHYDTDSKRLEWGLKLRSENQIALNYTIRLLGRTGVMNATLVSRPETLDADVRSFKAALQGFDFNNGERYAEFKQGDHIAEFGLAALVVGGAAAIATKKGFWAVLVSFFAAAWKFIAVAFLGLMAKIRSLFKSKS